MNRIITEAATETSAWRDTTLGEFVRLQRGHDLTDDDRRPGKVPVMGAAGMNGYHDTVMAKGPGVVIGRSGASFGKAHYCPEDYWPHNTGLYVTNFQGNDPRFTYYFLKSLDFSGYNSGSAQPSLNRNFIYRIPVCVPEPTEQRAIAGMLGALDDKIELNRRMNETLEALAQAEFGRMKDEGKAGTLGDIAENPKRGIDPSEIDAQTPYIGLEHMPRRSIALGEWDTAGDLESGKARFKRGEILFGKLRPYFHKVGVAPLDGVCSTDILTIVPKKQAWFGLVLGHLSSKDLIDHTDACSTGTKMPRASWSDIARYEIALPSEPVAAKLTSVIQPLVEHIIANIHESRTLAALRDALLPKLLSGAVRVKGVEK